MSMFQEFAGKQHTCNAHQIAFSWKLVFYLKLEELIKISFNEKAKLVETAVRRNVSNDDQWRQHFILFPGSAYKKKQTRLIPSCFRY